MIIIFVSLSGLIIDRGVVESQLLNFFQNRAGERATLFLGEILESIKRSEAHLLFSFVGFFIMIYGLLHFFNALKKSFFQIFRVHFGPEKTIQKTFINYIKSLSFSFYLALMVFVLVFVSIVAPFVLSFSSKILGLQIFTKIPLADLFIVLILTLVFLAIMYKSVSLNSLSWKSALIGAAFGTLLFSLLNVVLVLYFKLFDSAHAIYGASGSLIAFLLWVYYSSQILLIGALTSSIVNKTNIKQ